MRGYSIRIIGCDDETAFHLDLKEEEALLLERVSAISVELSDSPCMPAILIEPSKRGEKG